MPSWDFESEAEAAGAALVAGIDEVGRGPLAGPVVAAAVILPDGLRNSRQKWLKDLRDSKQVPEERREYVSERIIEIAIALGIGAASPTEIDAVGIVAATRRAMYRAIECLDPRPDHLLIDALELPGVPLPQTSIIKGDARSRSIAAASIVAKVTRDRLMRDVLHVRFPDYGFAGHKGYGSKAHIEAIMQFGPCPAHRMSFAPIRELFQPVSAASLMGAGGSD
jgi:ribonuclease HII